MSVKPTPPSLQPVYRTSTALPWSLPAPGLLPPLASASRAATGGMNVTGLSSRATGRLHLATQRSTVLAARQKSRSHRSAGGHERRNDCIASQTRASSSASRPGSERERSHTGHGKVIDRSRKGHTLVTGRSQTGHRQVTHRSRAGHTQVTDRSPSGHRQVTEGSHTGHGKVTERSQTGHRCRVGQVRS